MNIEYIEVTARGFNGATDTTDDRVIWLSASSLANVVELLAACKAPHLKVERLSSGNVVGAALDFVLPAQNAELVAHLFSFVVADMRAALERIGNDASVSALDFPRIARAALEVSK
jgi:hypothetical protein